MVRHSNVDKGEGGARVINELFLVVMKRHAVGDEVVKVFFGRLWAGWRNRGRRRQGSGTRLSVGLGMVGRWQRRGRAKPSEEAFLGVSQDGARRHRGRGGDRSGRRGVRLAPWLIRARGGMGVALVAGLNEGAHRSFHNGPPEIVSHFHSSFQGTGVAVSDEMEVTYNVTVEGDVIRDNKASSMVPSTIGVVSETMARGPLVNLFGVRGCYNFSSSNAYDTRCDSYRTFGLMTRLCLPLVRVFLMAVAFYVRILTQL